MSRLADKLARARELMPTPGHWLLFLRVAAWTALVPALLRVLSLPALMRIVTPKTPVGEFSEDQLETAGLINSYIVAILRLHPENQGKMCLRRSLVIYRFARLYGAPAVFCCGVSKEDGALVGHAWIELGGEKRFDPRADANFATTFSYPDDGKKRRGSR